MEEKLKFKNDMESKFETGKQLFEKYLKEDKLNEWAEEYLFFVDSDTRKKIAECYKQIYAENK